MSAYNSVSHQWILGRRFQDGYNFLAMRHGLAERTRCAGFPPCSKLLFDTTELSDRFCELCARNGLFIERDVYFSIRQGLADIDLAILRMDRVFFELVHETALNSCPFSNPFDLDEKQENRRRRH